MTLKKLVTPFFALLMIFAFSTPSAFAADVLKQNEVLVIKAEAQAKIISPQLNAKTIKAINAKSIQNLSLAVNTAKQSLKSYKGSKKASFQSRINSADLTLSQAGLYNAAILRGEKLGKDFNAYMNQFDAKPYTSEKAFTALSTENDQYPKAFSRVLSKSTVAALVNKYEKPFKSTLTDLTNFFSINKKIDSFVAYAKSHEDNRVWDQFYSIDNAINDDIADADIYDTLYEKWSTFLSKSFNSTEESNIKKAINDYITAYNARDAEALAELYPYKTDDDKKKIVDSFKALFDKMPPSGPEVVKSIELEFSYHDQATAYVTTTEIANGKETDTTVLVTLKKLIGKWIMIKQDKVN